jgi:Flp pilus assembly protein TadG
VTAASRPPPAPPGAARRWVGPPRPERGSAALELVLATPALVALMLFVVFVGRLAEARADVDRAAREAARAASLARSAPAAVAAGEEAARRSLGERGVACAALRVDVDASGFRPGGLVRAAVACTVALGDLSLLRIPGSRTIAAGFAEPVDAYRGVAG